MARVLFPNLLFEDELQRQTPAASYQAKVVADDLSCVIGLLALEQPGEETFVVIPDHAVPSDLPGCLNHVCYLTAHQLRTRLLNDAVFEPWGWSSAAVAAGRELGMKFVAPPVDAVRFVNSREFLAPRDVCVNESDPRTHKPFGVLCRTLDEVRLALTGLALDQNARRVIKANLSHAARNRLIGNGRQLKPSDIAWLQRRLVRHEPVAVEPWVELIAECGLQFFVPEQDSISPIRFVGAAEMLTDHAGRYIGSVVHPEASGGWWNAAIDHGLRIAAEAQALGFHGPLGIDCMQFRDPVSGAAHVRLSHDVNGRVTMGRVALALRSCLKPGQSGVWLHLNQNSGDRVRNELVLSETGGVQILLTSPGRIGDRSPAIVTMLLVFDGEPRLSERLIAAAGTTSRPSTISRLDDCRD